MVGFGRISTRADQSICLNQWLFGKRGNLS